MSRVRLVWLFAGFAILSGCASSREYRCPDPIGTIVRDECENFATRYESAKVALQAGIGPAQVGATFSEDALRSPTELIQVMSQRMVALCHDFNACRLTPADYLARREEMDRTMTAITALGEQLKRPDLPPAEREQMLAKLFDMLGAPPPRRTAPAAGTTTVSTPPEPEKPRKIAIYSDEPWFDSRLRPPVAPPVKEGFPRLVSPWGHGTLDHIWVPKSSDQPHDMKLGGFQVRPHLTLWGKLEADDRIELRFEDGFMARCPVKRNTDGVAGVYCPLPKERPWTGRTFAYRVAYYRAATDDWAEIGRAQWAVAPSAEKSWAVDYDEHLDQGWLYFFPEPPALPAQFEQPRLYVTLRLRKHHKATARCSVGGEPVTPAMQSERGSGQTGTLQDRPRYREVSPHSSQAVAEPFLEWWHYVFALPFVVVRAGAAVPEGLAVWPPKTGEWVCRVSVEGTPVRELHFTVKPDGSLEPAPGQRGQAGDLVHPWWKVDTRVLPNSVEANREIP